MVYIFLFPLALVLLFAAAVGLIVEITTDPRPWIVSLIICCGVLAVVGFQFFRDVWREWQAERRSKS